MGRAKIGVVGLGNCASSLIQGINYYGDKSREDAIGIMHWDIGGYRPYDIEVVVAFDIDCEDEGESGDDDEHPEPPFDPADHPVLAGFTPFTSNAVTRS